MSFYYVLQDAVIVLQDIARLALKLTFWIHQAISAFHVVLIALLVLLVTQINVLFANLVHICHHPNVYYVIRNVFDVVAVQKLVHNVLLENIIILHIKTVQLV